LAIDDERITFHPVLWDEEIEPGQTVKQVWFCGMHTDVGGGYQEQNLSDIPLVWMTHMAVNHGLIIYRNYNQHNEVIIAEDADGVMHDSRGNPLTRLYRQQTRVWEGRKECPVIHESVLKRVRNRFNQIKPCYEPWIMQLDYKVEQWIRYESQPWCAGHVRSAD
jgi:hypothetical protein